MNCLGVNEPTPICAENIKKFVEEIDTQTKKAMKRPLTPTALEFLLKQTKQHIKCESGRNQIDYMIANLHKKYGFKTESEKELERAWQKRNEKARAMGFDVEDDNDNKEPTEALRAAWKKRQKRGY